MGNKNVKHVKIGKKANIDQHINSMKRKGYTYLGETTVKKKAGATGTKGYRRLRFASE